MAEIENKTITAMNGWESLEELIRASKSGLKRSNAFGTLSTIYFDDSSVGKKIKKIIVKYGCVIDNITVVYADDRTISHGGTGGSYEEIVLDSDDYVVQIDGYIEDWQKRPEKVLSLITFKTKKGKTYGPYGRRPYANHTYSPINKKDEFSIKCGGKEIVALYGNHSSDNQFICRLGVYYK